MYRAGPSHRHSNFHGNRRYRPHRYNNDYIDEVHIDDAIVRRNRYLKSHCYFQVTESTFNFCKLSKRTQQYNEVCSLFKETMSSPYTITQIDRIDSPYLYGAYLLKKQQLRCRNPGNWQELQLFHGTKKGNVIDICIYNFDWRLYGSSTGHRFGKGVSFSPSASYAMNYCNTGKEKVMLLCDVLVKESCIGYKDMALPYDGCDTSESRNGQVIVKYDDHEFYPAYKIYFKTRNY